MLCTQVTFSRKLTNRYQPLDEVLIVSTPDDKANFQSNIALADLAQQIRSVKSPCAEPSEREAQKWHIQSFLDAGFTMQRHQCADAAMKVYGLSHRRGRQLYDLTLLEIRRAIWDETKHEPITATKLRGTKGLPLVRYTNFLSPEEFSKFATLMKDLAPSLVIAVKPANEPLIRKGHWPAVRENLQLILEGDPEATPLF